MKKLMLSAAVSLLLGTPVLAQTTILSSDPEVRATQEWQQLVDKTNADRLGSQTAARIIAVSDIGVAPAAGQGRLSSDAEVRWNEEWQQLVAKTNADRLAHGQGNLAAQGDVASVKSNEATDAVHAPAPAPRPAVTGGHYNSIQDYWQDR